MFITSLNDVLSVCTCYETLPQGLANTFSRILNVVTKTWYKKRNSVLEYYAAPSYDVTSASSDNSNNNWTTEEEYVDSRHRQDILLFSKASRRLCDTHWTYYTIVQRVPGQTDGLFSLNLQMVYSRWSRRGCGVAVVFVIGQRLMLEDYAIALTSGIVWSAEIQEVTLSVRSGLLCV